MPDSNESSRVRLTDGPAEGVIATSAAPALEAGESLATTVRLLSRGDAPS